MRQGKYGLKKRHGQETGFLHRLPPTVLLKEERPFYRGTSLREYSDGRCRVSVDATSAPGRNYYLALESVLLAIGVLRRKNGY